MPNFPAAAQRADCRRKSPIPRSAECRRLCNRAKDLVGKKVNLKNSFIRSSSFYFKFPVQAFANDTGVIFDSGANGTKIACPCG